MNVDVMLKNKEYQEIWQRYCGFLDYSLKEFMQIQERLLLEQIDMYADSIIGKHIMKNQHPQSMEEFRKMVPLTTYDDYADYLLPKNNDVLPSEPVVWIQTTWEGGKAPIKVAPYTKTMISHHRDICITCIILSTSKAKYHFDLKVGMNFLNGMAPLPYLTGLLPYSIQGEYTVNFMPSIEAGNAMSFGERNKAGFTMGMRKGIDLYYGLSSVIVKMGESFVEGFKSNSSGSLLSYDLKMIKKLAKAKLNHKFKEKTIYPKDVFDLKGFVCAGTDSIHFKDRIEEYWGVRPLEIFGGTEATAIGAESWSKNGLILFPNICFYEFIPMDEYYRNLQDPDYVPRTYLMDEIRANEDYEIVITTLKGGAFARYRIGDIFRCERLESKEDGIALPHFTYVDRVDPIIDLAGFTRITEATITSVISLSRLNVANWFAIKKYDEQKRPYIAMYLEMQVSEKGEGLLDPDLIKEQLEIYFTYIDEDYRNLKKMIGIEPLEVHLLPLNTIKKYTDSIQHKMSKVNPFHYDVVEVLNLAKSKE